MVPTKIAGSHAKKLAEILLARRHRLVLAESCTCGAVAATLGEIPGISSVFCGSAVTYQEETKSCWLEIEPQVFYEDTAVSPRVAEQMVRGVLSQTSHATVAASVTGHLGPHAPADQDGLIYVGTGLKEQQGQMSVDSHSYWLKSSERGPRRDEAVERVLDALIRAILSK